jgi:hypothetical protein
VSRQTGKQAGERGYERRKGSYNEAAAMTEEEAFYDESKWDEEVLHEAGEFRNGQPYLGRWEPDRYPDEPKKEATQAQRDAAAEHIRLRRKIQRDAIFFAVSIDNLSRTKKSAKIRKEAARFLICKHDHPVRLAERLGCSVSQFYRAAQWVKKHVRFHE